MDMSGITAETIQDAVECYIRQEGTPQAAARALVKDTLANTEAGTQARAKGLALAHVVEHHTQPPGQLEKFIKLGGNMRKFYENDIAQLGIFIAAYPETVTELAHWAEMDGHRTRDFVEKCQSITAKPDCSQEPHQLMRDLREPDTILEAIKRMADHMNQGNWGAGADERRIRTLMASMVTAEKPEATLRDLEEHGMNLYKALTPLHLGKAIATGWVDWAEITEWTAPSRQHKQHEVDTAEAPAMEEREEAPVSTQCAAQTELYQLTRSRKRQRELCYEQYQDLRQEYPPVDPLLHEARYEGLRKKPKSPPGTLICKFQPKELTDTRIRRWEWWAALSQIKVYVREYYMYTNWTGKINSAATGTPGQEVVRTSDGTITWIPNDKRIVITELGAQLQAQMRAGFPPWDPTIDMAKHYHRGKIPVNIVNAFQGKALNPSFQ